MHCLDVTSYLLYNLISMVTCGDYNVHQGRLNVYPALITCSAITSNQRYCSEHRKQRAGLVCIILVSEALPCANKKSGNKMLRDWILTLGPQPFNRSCSHWSSKSLFFGGFFEIVWMHSTALFEHCFQTVILTVSVNKAFVWTNQSSLFFRVL